MSLSTQYPTNTIMELTLTDSSTVKGLVYCTDEISQSIVIQRSLIHTTLSSEIIVVHASSVKESKAIELPKGEEKSSSSEDNIQKYGVSNVEEIKNQKIMNVSRRALEERERRALRLAEESFSHVNQKATPQGQKIFDKLLKACNEVSWNGQSILVLNHIRVDPPYTPNDCTLVDRSGGLDEHSLERVKKIVGVANDA
ncbi:hypothetical protein ACHAWO_006558 [Cyclotella atomus]|uniref:AD domain-containing protein n=1 Tax=Cyclotella atomus TaxID=382360 RepID=A0ABD3NHH8_9STRA